MPSSWETYAFLPIQRTGSQPNAQVRSGLFPKRCIGLLRMHSPAFAVYIELDMRRSFPLLLVGMCVLPSGEAQACGPSANQALVQVPLFAVAFVAVASTVAVLAGIVWLVMHAFSKCGSQNIGVALIGSVILGIALALVGVFALPHFEGAYSQMGVELPGHTQAVVSLRYALLVPLLFVGVTAARSAGATATYSRFLIAESILLALVLWSIYAPIFKLC